MWYCNDCAEEHGLSVTSAKLHDITCELCGLSNVSCNINNIFIGNKLKGISKLHIVFDDDTEFTHEPISELRLEGDCIMYRVNGRLKKYLLADVKDVEII